MHVVRRDDPRYMEAVVKKKSQEDPREIVIREKTAAQMLKEEWARDAFARIRDIQIEYLKDAVAHADDQEHVHARTQNTVRELSSLLRSSIVSGSEFLKEIPRGSPVLVATNHLGAYKLVGIKPKEDIGVDIPGYDAMYPYLMYFSALAPVADALGDTIYYVSEDFPGVFGDVHSAAGFVHVPPASIPIEGGRTAVLTEQTRATIIRHKNAAIVNFPEGGTSGKYTDLDIYDLDPFKTGGYVVASELGIRIVPVAQYFDKDKGMQLCVFDPVVPPQGASKDVYEHLAKNDQEKMQAWLDVCRNRMK